jgi:subtilisin family serine protease
VAIYDLQVLIIEDKLAPSLTEYSNKKESGWEMASFRIVFLTAGFLLAGSIMALDLSPEVLRAMGGEAPVAVVVHLAGQYDLSLLPKSFRSHAEQARAVEEALISYHRAHAAPLLAFLSSRNVQAVSSLWITNSLRVRAAPSVLRGMFRSGGIESVELDVPKDVELGWSETPFAARVTAAPKIAWGVQKIRAPEVWEKGVDGKGIIVAEIDTGINPTHPDVVSNIWHNPGETGLDAQGHDKATNGIDDDANGYIDDVIGWNFANKNKDPIDDFGHGSQVSGIVAGMGVGGTQTGVAPHAQIMALKTVNDLQTFEATTWDAYQYVVHSGVRVVTMSMRIYHSNHPNYAKWRRIDEVLLAAGIVHLNAAGNEGYGAEPHNIAAPPSNPPAWLAPGQPQHGGLSAMISVGALDSQDKLLPYSSVGPVTWEDIVEYKDYPYDGGKQPGLIKPEVCAPAEVQSISPTGTGYVESFGGTSSATPHVAGVVALLLSAKPNLTVAQVTESLQMSAVAIGSPFNNQCGTGRIDAMAALDYAQSKF